MTNRMNLAELPALKETELPRLLLVDDDEATLRALSRLLSSTYRVVTAASAELAIAEISRDPFDVILSDVHLGGMDGVEFLRQLRQEDLGVPVLLMTGEPSVDAAARAVEHGATRYLFKPVDLQQLREALAVAVSRHRLAEAQRRSLNLLGGEGAGSVGLDAVVGSALQSLRVAWQPIVSWQRRRTVAYEALMRSALPTPEALLDAAQRAGRSVDVGRAMRRAAAKGGALAPVADLYVNISLEDLLDADLYDEKAPLSALSSKVVLEITERAPLESIGDLRARCAKLRKMGFRLGLDDLGAGGAGLASFARLEPDVVKIDGSLVRDVHRSPTRRRLIASILSACRDLKCIAIAEGVELPAERDALADLGCELFQGFLFARPAFAFPEPQF